MQYHIPFEFDMSRRRNPKSGVIIYTINSG